MRAWTLGAVVVLVACGSRKPEKENADSGEAGSGRRNRFRRGHGSGGAHKRSLRLGHVDSFSVDECGLADIQEFDGEQFWLHLNSSGSERDSLLNGDGKPIAIDCTLDWMAPRSIVSLRRNTALTIYAATMVMSSICGGDWTRPY